MEFKKEDLMKALTKQKAQLDAERLEHARTREESNLRLSEVEAELQSAKKEAARCVELAFRLDQIEQEREGLLKRLVEEQERRQQPDTLSDQVKDELDYLRLEKAENEKLIASLTMELDAKRSLAAQQRSLELADMQAALQKSEADFASERLRLFDEIQQLRSEASKEQERVRSLETQLSLLTAENNQLQKLREAQERQEIRILEIQEEKAILVSQVEISSGEAANLREEVKSLQMRLVDLQPIADENATLRKSLSEIQNRLSESTVEANERIHALEIRLSEAANTSDLTNNIRELVETGKQRDNLIDQLRREVEAERLRAANAEELLLHAQEAEARARIALKEATELSEKLVARNEELQIEIAAQGTKEEELRSVHLQNEVALSELAEVRAALIERRDVAAHLEKELRTVQEQLTAAQNQRDGLQLSLRDLEAKTASGTIVSEDEMSELRERLVTESQTTTRLKTELEQLTTNLSDEVAAKRRIESKLEEAQRHIRLTEEEAMTVKRELASASARFDAMVSGQPGPWVQQAQDDDMPVPTHVTLDSPVIQTILQAWTQDQKNLQFFNKWCGYILSGGDVSPNAQFQKGVELSKCTTSVKDGLLSMLIPMLRARPDIEVSVFTRERLQVFHDVRLRVTKTDGASHN